LECEKSKPAKIELTEPKKCAIRWVNITIFYYSLYTMNSFEKPSNKAKKPLQIGKSLATLGLATMLNFAPGKAVATKNIPLENNFQLKQEQVQTHIEKENVVITSRSQIKQLVWTGKIKSGDIVEVYGIKRKIMGDKETGKVGRKTIELLEAIPQAHNIISIQHLSQLFQAGELRLNDTLIFPNKQKQLLVGEPDANGNRFVTQNSIANFDSVFEPIAKVVKEVEVKQGSPIPTVNHTQKLIELSRKTPQVNVEKKIPTIPTASDLSQYLTKQKPQVATEPKPQVKPTPIPTPKNSIFTIAQGRPIPGYESEDLRGPKLLFIDGVTTSEKDFRRILTKVEQFMAPGKKGELEGVMAIAHIVRSELAKGNTESVATILNYLKQDANDRYDVFFDDWGTAKVAGDLSNYGKSISKLDYNSTFFKDAQNLATLKARLDQIEKPSRDLYKNQLRADSRKTMMSLAGSITRISGNVFKNDASGIEFLNGSVNTLAMNATTDQQQNEVIRKLTALGKDVNVANNSLIKRNVNTVIEKRITELQWKLKEVNDWYLPFSKLAPLDYNPQEVIENEIRTLGLVQRNLTYTTLFLK
jgi:hypothetical protein